MDGVSIAFGVDELTGRSQCQDIMIVTDSIFEDTEDFDVILSSPDPAVQITSDNFKVFINDSTGTPHNWCTVNLGL